MREIRPAWIAAVLFALVGLVVFLTRASETIAPDPVALWVAIQPEGEEVARSGRVEVAAGTAFRLHAVLEAETFRGGRVYYTDAKRLEILGEPVPEEELEPWPGRLEARVLWFTVEGSSPFREADPQEPLVAPSYKEMFRPDWGNAWTVSGDVRPTVENFLPGEEGTRRSERFGTQRFQVRLELFGKDNKLVPRARFASPGAASMWEPGAELPTLVASLPGALETPSRVFGLTQIEVSGVGASPAGQERLAGWTKGLVAFSRVSVLASWLASEGVSWEELRWQNVELGVSEAVASPGDMLRVGRRLVWFLEDRGRVGLDDGDWCLDFERGARVFRIGDVFVGEGLVAWARRPTAGTDD